MKFTQQELNNIIKEELQSALSEKFIDDPSDFGSQQEQPVSNEMPQKELSHADKWAKVEAELSPEELEQLAQDKMTPKLGKRVSDILSSLSPVQSPVQKDWTGGVVAKTVRVPNKPKLSIKEIKQLIQDELNNVHPQNRQGVLLEEPSIEFEDLDEVDTEEMTAAEREGTTKQFKQEHFSNQNVETNIENQAD